MKLLIFVMLIASAAAFFMPQQRTPNQAGATPGVAPRGGGAMPDMGTLMGMVRQILMLLLPKLMANPALMSAIASGGKPMAPAMPMPSRPPAPAPPMAGPPMGGAPISGAMFPPRAPGPAPLGGGMMVMPSGDKFKDMRLMELLQDPTVGLANDPYIRQFIPTGPHPWGWSLPDVAKDHITYSIGRRISRRGHYTPKEREIVGLIGDPIEMMPSIFGPGSRIRPM